MEQVMAGVLRLGQIMLRAGDPKGAGNLVESVLPSFDSTEQRPSLISLHGALLLTTSIAAARMADRRESIEAERLAPEAVRFNPVARDVIQGCLRRSRGNGAGVGGVRHRNPHGCDVDRRRPSGRTHWPPGPLRVPSPRRRQFRAARFRRPGRSSHLQHHHEWAAGISDTLALGLLNEALGASVPVEARPYVNEALAAHPAYQASLAMLADHGVTFTPI